VGAQPNGVPVRLCLIDRPIQLPRKRCDTEAIKSELTRDFFLMTQYSWSWRKGGLQERGKKPVNAARLPTNASAGFLSSFEN